MSRQLQAILSDLRRHRQFADFTHDGFGERLMNIDVTAIEARCRAELDPYGHEWAALSEAYAAWKKKMLGRDQIGILFRRMLAHEELRGSRYISATDALMTYGVTEEARNEAEWFQEGDPARNRPPRPFYDFTASANQTRQAYLDKRFEKYVG